MTYTAATITIVTHDNAYRQEHTISLCDAHARKFLLDQGKLVRIVAVAPYNEGCEGCKPGRFHT